MFKLADEFYMPFISLFTEHKNKKLLDIKKLVYAITTKDKALTIRTFDRVTKQLENIDF